MREASLMKRQRHLHILELLAAFVDGCDLWMIIPFVAGGSLESLLKRGYQKVGGTLNNLRQLRKASHSTCSLYSHDQRQACNLEEKSVIGGKLIVRVGKYNVLHYKAWLDSLNATTALHMCLCLAGPARGGDSHHHEAGAGGTGIPAQQRHYSPGHQGQAMLELHSGKLPLAPNLRLWLMWCY